ncbi:hypothetical protein [Caulobacter sp.]|uniref:hypothetical protein n=1 Tax=Caulobacter sp. TaxID=78 RepID=UPI002B499481|nr:hypothetical protein [Caulobacter sp.]HJV42556.1 hypothetical protein [Caulobacter sp.]
MADTTQVSYRGAQPGGSMSFEKRVASVHPALLTTIAIAGSLFFGVFTSKVDDPFAYRALVAIAFFAFIALGFLWFWSIYALATSRLGVPASWSIAFVLTPLVLAACKLLFGDDAASNENLPSMALRFAGGVLFIGCVWKAAEAFEIALCGKGVSVRKVAGTATLFFSIVGAWTLRERILTLVARSADTAQEA